MVMLNCKKQEKKKNNVIWNQNGAWTNQKLTWIQDSSQPKLLWGKINLIVECDIEFEDGMEHEEFWDVYEALCVTLWSKYCAW